MAVDIKVGGNLERQAIIEHYIISMIPIGAVATSSLLNPMLAYLGGTMWAFSTLIHLREFLRAGVERYSLPTIQKKHVWFAPLASTYESYNEYGVILKSAQVARIPFILGNNKLVILTVQGIGKFARINKGWKRDLKPFFNELQDKTNLEIYMADPRYNHYYVAHKNKSTLPLFVYENMFEKESTVCAVPIELDLRGRYKLLGKVIPNHGPCLYPLPVKRLKRNVIKT